MCVVILCNRLALAYVFDIFFPPPFFSLCHQNSTDLQCTFISPDKYEATTVHIKQLMVSGFAIFFKLAVLLESEENQPHFAL